MKKYLFLLIGAGLICMVSAFAQSGKMENLRWNLKDSTLTISGKGAMPDYKWSTDAPWYEYRESINTVTIKTGVTTIGNSAFSDCRGLTSITIPSGVTMIGNEAFYNCKSLTSIIIPSSVTTIGDWAFKGCENLTSVTISNGVTTIGYGAFTSCENLTSINLPSSVTTIGNFAFKSSSLISIDVENENSAYTSENGVLFNKNKTTLICCPCGKTSTYIVPSSVTTIGESAFSSCSNLTSITIPSSVTTIESHAFYHCNSLTSIIVPSSVTTIENHAFGECSSLTSIINLNPVPIKIKPQVFWLVNQSECTLKVPKSAVSAYQNAEVWKEFNIVGIETN